MFNSGLAQEGSIRLLHSAFASIPMIQTSTHEAFLYLFFKSIVNTSVCFKSFDASFQPRTYSSNVVYCAFLERITKHPDTSYAQVAVYQKGYVNPPLRFPDTDLGQATQLRVVRLYGACVSCI